MTGRRVKSLTDIRADAVRVSARYRAAWDGNGYPWCDGCGRPALLVPRVGWMHSTDLHPGGVPAWLDGSGHRVTAADWWDLSVRPVPGDAGAA